MYRNLYRACHNYNNDAYFQIVLHFSHPLTAMSSWHSPNLISCWPSSLVMKAMLLWERRSFLVSMESGTRYHHCVPVSEFNIICVLLKQLDSFQLIICLYYIQHLMNVSLILKILKKLTLCHKVSFHILSLKC